MLKTGIILRLLGTGVSTGTMPLSICIASFGIQLVVTATVVLSAIHIAEKIVYPHHRQRFKAPVINKGGWLK